MKNEEVTIKNDDNAQQGSAARSGQKPEHGASSQLRCYNAQSWRVADLFGEDDDPLVPPPRK